MTTTTREVTTSSPEETIAFGRELAAGLTPPALVLLYGELGAGKTTLAKGLVAGLGAAQEDEVTSPTFVMVQQYERAGTGQRVYHVDLYRVERPGEFESLGLEDLLAEDAIVLVEWPERLAPQTEGLALPGLRPSLCVYLEASSEEERRLRVERLAG